MKKESSRTRTPSQYRARVESLAEQATGLANQTEFTERDLARAVELNQQYVDLLEEIESGPIVISASVTVHVDNSTVRFPGIDEVAEWISKSL